MDKNTERPKGKAPAFQFYVMDYMFDADGLSATSNGIWIRMLCKLHRARKRGETTATLEAWCRKCNCTLEELKGFLSENEVEQIADLTLDDEKLTVISRRMVRERKEREDANRRQREYEARKRAGENLTEPDKNLTTHSSSSTSSSSSNHKDNSPKREVSDNAHRVFEYWNSRPNLITHRSMTDTQGKHIRARLKDYSDEEIRTSIDNYDQILGDPSYMLDYRWKIEEFMTRSFEKFLSYNKPFLSYPQYNQKPPPETPTKRNKDGDEMFQIDGQFMTQKEFDELREEGRLVFVNQKWVFHEEGGVG